MMSDRELLDLAKKAMRNSYSPYSGFRVGAALMVKDGSVYTGVNVENASFSTTVCAERTAIFSAIADGKRDFVCIAIAGNSEPCMPCGVCRQVMSEFCDRNFRIIVEKDNLIYSYKLEDLLPHSFALDKDYEND